MVTVVSCLGHAKTYRVQVDVDCKTQENANAVLNLIENLKDDVYVPTPEEQAVEPDLWVGSRTRLIWDYDDEAKGRGGVTKGHVEWKEPARVWVSLEATPTAIVRIKEPVEPTDAGINWTDIQDITVFSSRPYDEYMNDKMWERSIVERKLDIEATSGILKKEAVVESAKEYSKIANIKVVVK